ncbi:chromosomal replication initiator protein DnaA [Desulfovibrio ferrophilus]|uniref:Chromosomal replication initiator protein DnaA n=1 Tax=Desulfovibrio ferrophilus TaxID=241368 RepID=A0A2Z6AUV9_9BACT|nr:chromosomal replication initiator protein DnaA [Desulfovibrio ferrophilus]BBD06966.1 chromosomal replication initiator protein dnaA [Desulfovibrio ferrophilus]
MLNAWPQILNILEKTLNPGLYQVWIKPLDAEVKDGFLKLYAPNPFVASWVRDRLSDSIAEAATQVMGSRPSIEVAVRPKAMQSAPCPTEDSTPVASNSTRRTGDRTQAKLLGLPNLAPSSLKSCNWQFSFDDFVVGPCNELAFVASQSMCRSGMDFDQLFLNSSPGLGKTHLLQAIGRQIARSSNRSNVRVGYLTAEQFATQLILSLKSRQVDRFKDKFREKLDVLLLEDIHFLQGKEHTQDELLETLKALQARGCKVVMSSSFLPRELKDVDDHLASRLCSGFLTTIDRPCLETRRNILESKAKLHQVQLPRDVSEMLAENLKDDVRQLESCLQSLVLKARLLGRGITPDLAESVLRNYTIADVSSIGFQKIVSHVCSYFELSQQQLASKSRKRDIVQARNTAFFLTRKYTDMPLKQIGSHFNRRHSTVLKGITNVEREISLQTPLGRQLDTVVQKIKTS